MQLNEMIIRVPEYIVYVNRGEPPCSWPCIRLQYSLFSPPFFFILSPLYSHFFSLKWLFWRQDKKLVNRKKKYLLVHRWLARPNRKVQDPGSSPTKYYRFRQRWWDPDKRLIGNRASTAVTGLKEENRKRMEIYKRPRFSLLSFCSLCLSPSILSL